MNTLKFNFGKQLKHIRKSKHFTQEQLAEKIEINLRQLARIEAGESFVTAETLQKICDALEISPDLLFKFNSLKNSQSYNFTTIIDKLEDITKDENKTEFINIAIEALNNKKSLEKLKLLIKGIELNK